ncbi:MAG: ferredoxin [Halanaerobacter sp.]
MKVEVIKDDCISCELCVNNVPEVFSWDDEDKAEAIAEEVASDLEDSVKDAITSCPTDAIEEV